jgi:SAM-dependent methyltransferase
MDPVPDRDAAPPETPPDLRAWFGDIDIYLFDQLMKGRLRPGMRILDAGCGTGRNLNWFFRTGYDVHAVDEDEDALDHVREMAARLAPGLPADHFRRERIEDLSFPEGHFDAVICNAVLHFAEDEDQFQRMLDALWRVLKPQGVFFARLASSIGLEDRLERLPGGKYRMLDGGEWLLAGEGKLILATQRLGGEMLEPFKTVNVQNLRGMTTWVLRKRATRPA